MKKKNVDHKNREGCHLNANNFKEILPGIMPIKPTPFSRERANALGFYYLSVGKLHLKVRGDRRPQGCM